MTGGACFDSRMRAVGEASAAPHDAVITDVDAMVVVREAPVAGLIDTNGQRPARSLARPVALRAEPRVRAALPFALCDVRPVIRPQRSSTQAPILSKRPSALLRRELLNITPLLTQIGLPNRLPQRTGGQTLFSQLEAP